MDTGLDTLIEISGDPHVSVSYPGSAPLCYDISGTDRDELLILNSENLKITGGLVDEGNSHHHSVRLETIKISSKFGEIEIGHDFLTIFRLRKTRHVMKYDTDRKLDTPNFSVEIFSQATRRLPGGMIKIGKNVFNFSIKVAKRSIKFRIFHLETNVSDTLGFSKFSKYEILENNLIQVGDEKFNSRWDKEKLCHVILNPPQPRLIGQKTPK